MYFVVYFKFTNAKLILIIQDYILQNIIHFPSSLTFSLCFYHPSLSLLHFTHCVTFAVVQCSIQYRKS